MAKIILIWMLTFLFKSEKKSHFLTVYRGGVMHENIIIRRLHYASRVGVPRPLRTPAAAPPTKQAFRVQIQQELISDFMRTNRFFLNRDYRDSPRAIIVYNIPYMNYQSVCPFVGIGCPTPPPPPARECVLPLDPNGGESTLPGGWGGGGPNSDEGTDTLIVHVRYIVLAKNTCQ